MRRRISAELVGARHDRGRVQPTGLTRDRSIAPEIDTAAPPRAPTAPQTGAETDATPDSRSLTLCAQPRRRTPGQGGGVEHRALQPPVQPVRLLPGEQDLGGRPGVHGELAPTGIESRRPIGRSAAATQIRWSPWRR